LPSRIANIEDKNQLLLGRSKNRPFFHKYQLVIGFFVTVSIKKDQISC
jgi:hypothetical protein